MARTYYRHRRAYPPRLWPIYVTAIALVLIPAQLIDLPRHAWGVISLTLWGLVVGVATPAVRWLIWKRRHPIVPARERLDAMRRAAPWN